MSQPPIPPPLPRSQTGSWLSFHAGQHDPRRVAAEEAHRAELIRRANRRVNTVRLVEQLPRTRPIPVVPPGPPPVPTPGQATYPVGLGGCANPTCAHRGEVHGRGKDHVGRCKHCDCVKFRKPPWRWTDWAWFAFTLLLIACAVVIVGVIWAAW